MAQIPQNRLFKTVLPGCNAGSRLEKQAKSTLYADQIERAGFTQSWIAMTHYSRTGNAR
jgi:hypothetical protein